MNMTDLSLNCFICADGVPAMSEYRLALLLVLY